MKATKSTFFQIISRKELLLFVILFIAGLSLFGWLAGKVIVASVLSDYIPIAPSTAVLFIILSIFFLLNIKLEKLPVSKSIGITILILVVLFCLNVILDYFFNFPWDIENIFIKNPETLGYVPIGRMSPITSLLFILTSISIISRGQSNTNKVKYIGGIFSLLTFIVSTVLLIGYLYKAPLLYGSTIIPVALPTSICFLLFSITLLRVFELKFWTFNLLQDNKVTIQLLKSFLPFVVFIIILQGFLISILSIGHENPTVTTALILFAVTAITIFIIIRVSTVLGSNFVRAEKSLKGSEEKFSRAINFAPFPIMLHAENGKVLAISKGWTDSAGYTLDDIPTTDEWTERAYGQRQQNVKEYIDTLYEIEGSKNEGEYSIICKDGTRRIWDFSSAFLGDFDTDGRVVISMAKDITERKNTEQALKKNEERLLQLNADKDIFIQILGHDLKNPFNNLLGISELLTKNIRNYHIDKIENFVNGINISARNAHNLLEDLLQWARSQQGSIVFKPLELSLADTCKNVLEVLRPSADAKNIVINCLAEDHLNVFADADMLKTVLRNLVSNAIKFTNNGGSININAELDSENVTISVSDNGVGIPPENLTKLFDITEVLTTKGTEKESGTGLGLLLCKEFVEKHGGKIWVESDEEKGSDFKFSLPNNNKPDEANVAKNNMSSAVTHSNIANLKILITDDDEASRMLLGISVETFAKEILYAENGLEAVVACQDNPNVDLILMDIKMPEMDGYEATAKIREFNKEVIIIAQTAFGLIGDREKAIQAGCTDYINKPVDMTKMFELINKHISN